MLESNGVIKSNHIKSPCVKSIHAKLSRVKSLPSKSNPINRDWRKNEAVGETNCSKIQTNRSQLYLKNKSIRATIINN